MGAQNSIDKSRVKLLEQMHKMEQSGLTCQGCEAPCCTFHYNSMRITEGEGLAIIKYLISIKSDLKILENKCRATIQEYRLDKDFFMKPDARLRRHYTCPLFTDKELGCSIPAEHKPLGCLAFNPTDSENKGKTCKAITYPDIPESNRLEIPRTILAILEKKL